MPKVRSIREIPTYSSCGRRIRNHSLTQIERLLDLDRVLPIRNRKGCIIRAHIRPLDGANPLRATASMGQRYSFLVRVGETARLWQHRRLAPPNDVQADLYLRSIFRAVPLSCMRGN